MSGLSGFAHVLLFLVACATLYLYFPLLERLFPVFGDFPGKAHLDGPNQTSDWLSAEDAARRFRDQLGQHAALYDMMRIFDSESRSGGADGVVWAFRFWWPEGFQHGLLEARGVPIAGSVAIPVRGPVTEYEHSVAFHRQAYEGRADQITLPDGQEVADLQFEKSGIDRLVQWMIAQTQKTKDGTNVGPQDGSPEGRP